ncbi:hypothetical protein [uncultured Maricaulis sp.]|jgi:hypothetical protein|uniref:hypothetical protein n=1 Tax=uncultured Maricaulis sp. TaxID=174710 RepID=UPI0026206CB6|nr:hypothetical protein [uncultured Maricaulis sp.]
MTKFNPPVVQPGHIHFANRLIDIDDHLDGKQSWFWIYCLANMANGRTYYACEPEFDFLAAEVVAHFPLPVFGGAS